MHLLVNVIVDLSSFGIFLNRIDSAREVLEDISSKEDLGETAGGSTSGGLAHTCFMAPSTYDEFCFVITI